MDSVLDLKSLNVGYGKHQVLSNVTFSVCSNEVVLLTGGNGSGKSTLLKTIYGLLPPFGHASECIFFNGSCLSRRSPSALLHAGLAYVPQKNNTFLHMTGKDNILLTLAGSGDSKYRKQRLAELINLLPALDHLIHKKACELSGGQRHLVALGMALARKPKMIMMDEPSAGLSQERWIELIKLIENLKNTGVAFLIVEHRLSEATALATQVLEVKFGKIVSRYNAT